jgi:hypothetical protein
MPGGFQRTGASRIRRQSCGAMNPDGKATTTPDPPGPRRETYAGGFSVGSDLPVVASRGRNMRNTDPNPFLLRTRIFP